MSPLNIASKLDAVNHCVFFLLLYFILCVGISMCLYEISSKFYTFLSNSRVLAYFGRDKLYDTTALVYVLWGTLTMYGGN